jgi:hypothetical protein
MTKTLLPLCAALLLFPATSFAAPASDGSYVNDEGARVTQNGEVREIVIDDGEDIDGDSLKPIGENLSGRGLTGHASMITLRRDFLAQLINLSADI